MQIGEGVAGGAKSKGSPAPSDDGDDESVAASLRFVEIRGLYRPGLDDGVRRDDGSAYGCGYQVGYTSTDGRGRVFINHRPRASASEAWDAVHAKDVQYIEIIVRVEATGTLPASVQVEWSWTDPDDPSDAGMHAAAARHIDRNGPGGNDNRGECDFPQAGASPHPAFEAVQGFTMAPSGSTCRTAVVSSESRVRLHLTNVGGDNFRVNARLVNGAQAPVVSTGTMTMWKRIDVEYHQMRSVFILPVADVARGLEPAFVQLDFTAPIDLEHQSALTRRADYETAARGLAQRLFRHARQPGWFLLVAADLESSQSTTNPRRRAYEGAGEIYNYPGSQWIVIPIALRRRPALIRLRNGSDELTFGCTGRVMRRFPAPGQTAVEFDTLRYFNVLDPLDGTFEHAHSRPNHYLPIAQPGEAQGLGFPTSVDCEVMVGFAHGAYGITPPIRRGRHEYFVGRSFVFMGRFDSADESVQTAVHELCHGFGFAHSCGRTAANPSSGHACAMAILDHWVFRPGTGTLQRWHHPPRRTEFCEYHLRGLRETHLEDNPALWQWNG